MKWKIISFSKINAPPPYTSSYFLALIEDENGQRAVAQIDKGYNKIIAIGTLGVITENESPNGKITAFTPDDGIIEEITRVAIVTGSSRGIGKAIALALAEKGMCVVINNSFRNEEGQKVTEDLIRAGKKAIYLPAAINDMLLVTEMVEKTITTFGRIDLLVNNAGITRDKKIDNMSEQVWDEVISTNLTGTFYCTKAVLPYMQKQDSGCIINISSIVGEIGNVGQANYAASKGGMIAFTKTLAKECASAGIRVNAITPGFIKTDMIGSIPKGIMSDIITDIPLGRLGKPEDIANTVVFLSSSEAEYITGQVIGVNGGLRM